MFTIRTLTAPRPTAAPAPAAPRHAAPRAVGTGSPRLAITAGRERLPFLALRIAVFALFTLTVSSYGAATLAVAVASHSTAHYVLAAGHIVADAHGVAVTTGTAIPHLNLTAGLDRGNAMPWIDLERY